MKKQKFSLSDLDGFFSALERFLQERNNLLLGAIAGNGNGRNKFDGGGKTNSFNLDDYDLYSTDTSITDKPISPNDTLLGTGEFGIRKYRRPDGSTYTHYPNNSVWNSDVERQMQELKSGQEKMDARYRLDNPLETMQRNSEMMSQKYGNDWRGNSPYGMAVGNGEDVAGSVVALPMLLAACETAPRYRDFTGKAYDTEIQRDSANHVIDSLSNLGYYYKQNDSTFVPRQPNTSSTSEHSTYLENTMYDKIRRNQERVNHRTDPYKIPYGNRTIEIVVNGVTRKLPVNALDSVAKYGGLTNTGLTETFGLPFRETMLGRQPYWNYEDLPEGYGFTDLGNANYFKAFGEIPAEYLVRDFRYNGDLEFDGKRDEPIPLTTPPLQHAYEFFQTGKYNPGNPNHTKQVRESGEVLWNESTGNFRKWWNEEGKKIYEDARRRKNKQ